MDNSPNYLGPGSLEWEVREILNLFVDFCPSDLSFENVCSGSWHCIIEPVICPPHGTQTQTCVQNCEDEDKKVVTEMECSPGICSGCYVPRWLGSDSFDNKCIPYGMRFEHEFGSFEEAFYDEDSDDFTVNDWNEETEGFLVVTAVSENNLTLLVNKTLLESEAEDFEYSVSVSPDISTEGYDIYYVTEDEKADITIQEFAGAKQETLSISVTDISYNSENPNESLISLIAGYSGTRTQPLVMNAYCDIDGIVKEQKAKYSDGSWAKCQNSFECESNVCSSGECIEVASMIQNAGTFKRIAVTFWCKFTNPINDDEYSQCVYDLIGGK